MKRLLLALAFIGLTAGSASAACTGPAVMHDFPGTSFNMSLGTTPDGGCGSNVLVSTWGGVTLGAPSNYGTSPGPVAVPGVNAFITNTPSVSVASGGIASGAYSAGSFAAGALVAGALVDGADVTLGTKGDTAYTGTGSASAVSVLKGIYASVSGPIPLNVNGTATAQTGVTPGSAQTGTIVAANTDQTSLGGVAYGAMANFGSSPGAVKAPNANSFNFVTDQVGGGIASMNGDPCQTTAKTTLPITLASAAVKVIATGVSAKKIYVCHIDVNNNAADNVAIFEATTGTTCATSAVAVIGGGTSVASAGSGYNFSANGGISLGAGGFQVLQTSVNNNDLCVAQSAATQLSGSITYVTR